MKKSFTVTNIIAHIDMDAFFAAIEERNNPQWRGLAIVVGADPKDGSGRGVVSTANYEARKFGIHSAMPISQAWKAAQIGKKDGGRETIFLPPNGRQYSQVSQNIMEIIGKYAGAVEQVSVDEAFIDLSSAGSFDEAVIMCKKIKKEIKQKEKLTASIGLAPNKLVAKIASDIKKPDGLTVVEPSEVEKFMRALSLRKIPGIGPKTQIDFDRKGIRTVDDALGLSEADLYEMMGEWGLELYEKLRGDGDTKVLTEVEDAKSIGEQVTFDEDTFDSRIISDALSGMAHGILENFARDGFSSYKRIILTVRFEDFRTVTRSHTLDEVASSEDLLRKETLKMLLPFLDRRENPSKKKIRLVGMRIEQLG